MMAVVSGGEQVIMNETVLFFTCVRGMVLETVELHLIYTLYIIETLLL